VEGLLQQHQHQGVGRLAACPAPGVHHQPQQHSRTLQAKALATRPHPPVSQLRLLTLHLTSESADRPGACRAAHHLHYSSHILAR
jgi:hypothetical protein